MSTGSTVKQYPVGIDTFAIWQDDIDTVIASNVNDCQDQIVAIESTLGTNPQGTLPTLKDRLFVSLNNDGTLKNYAQGATGLQGVQGETGVRGHTGLQGIQGTGVQGIQGTTGIQGLQGNQGTTGLQGSQGQTGLQGIQGNTGVQGIQGNTGIQGIQGNTGAGIQGVTGLQGSQGQTGVQGVQGQTGLHYTNAYGEIYVEDGSTAQTFNIAPSITTCWNTAAGVNGLSSGTTPDKTNNQITVNTTGIYLVIFNAAIINGANGTIYKFYIRVNGIEQAVGTYIKPANADVVNVGTARILSLSVNDIITVYGESDTNTKAATLTDATINVHRVG